MDGIQLFAVKRTAKSTDFKLRFILDDIVLAEDRQLTH